MSAVEFDNVLTHLDRYETCIENYLIQKSECKLLNGDEEQPKYVAYQEPGFEAKQPHIGIWEFMNQEKLQKFMLLKRKSYMRKYIDENIGKNNPKGEARTIFIELMYNVSKFCRTSNFNLEKTGALLSQFYMTHAFFTSKLDTSAEKVYIYFKDLVLCHSLPFPPSHVKIFSHKETKEVMELFCKLYLRNIPLIRFLSLPNFAFYLNYELEPEPVVSHKKQKKEKPAKEGKGSKKASEKSSKKGKKT